MTTSSGRAITSPVESRRPPYPVHKLVAAIERDVSATVVTALEAAGFPADDIQVVTADDYSNLDQPVDGSGVRGFLSRLGLMAGADLDEIEKARRELVNGYVLVQVLALQRDAQDLAEGVLRQHGGHAMSYFGRWRVWTLPHSARQARVAEASE